MDVIVTQTVNRQRKYRVNDVKDSDQAVSMIQVMNDNELPEGVTLLDEGQSNNVQHQTQQAPARVP